MSKTSELLETVVKSLVSKPEEVKIVESSDDMGILLTLDVSQVDMGKVIGKSGTTVGAIRTLLRVSGMTEQSRVSLKLNENEQEENS